MKIFKKKLFLTSKKSIETDKELIGSINELYKNEYDQLKKNLYLGFYIL